MAIKFRTNEPQTLVFPWGDFLNVNGQYGEQFLYSVEASGERDKLYATRACTGSYRKHRWAPAAC